MPARVWARCAVNMDFGNMSAVLIDVTLTTGLTTMAADAAEAEGAGYAGIWTFEGAHDPFLPLLLAGSRNH